MTALRSALFIFIARRDLQIMLQQRETLLWTFAMPILFFYFIGTVTGGMGSPTGSEDRPDALALRAPEDAGFLLDELVGRLEEQRFRVDRPETEEDWTGYARRLTVTRLPAEDTVGTLGTGVEDASLTDWVLSGEQVSLRFENSLEGPNAAFDQIRIARAVYTVLADLVVTSQASDASVTPSAGSFADLAAMPRSLTLNVQTAGLREDPPVGYAQAIPGTMVMFTMLVLLTSGAVQLVIERKEGLLRRLASTPISRGSVVLGKLAARVAMGMVQIGFAMAVGTVLFGMDWGPSLFMVVAVLFGWATFNASLAIVLGNAARTEGQMSGIGITATMMLAALGGAWWPIEVMPGWMQQLALFLPTGWAMDAMHKLVSFAYPPAVALPHLAGMLGGALILGWAGAKTFRYE